MSTSASSGVVTNPLKRNADDSSQTANKKPKKHRDLDSKIEDALERIEALRQAEALPVGGRNTLDAWSKEIADIKAGKDRIRPQVLGVKFPDVTGQAPVVVLFVEKAHEAMNSLAIAYETFRTTRAPPSSFARDWATEQERHGGLLCLRPVERRSIPIRTFNGIFGHYVQRLGEPVPRNARGDAASRAACALCATMGDAFEEKDDRWQRRFFLDTTNERSAHVDFVLLSHLDIAVANPCLIREDKFEPGSAGDPYMQCARDYQIFIQWLKERGQEKWLALGAPTFLVSLAGASISVAGAFYDGESCIVEPLGPSLWMLGDFENARQTSLAQLLYSLDLTLEELVRYQARPPQGAEEQVYPPGIPRVYPCTSFKPHIANGSLQGLDKLLHQAKPIQLSSQHAHFQSEVQGQKILVKMLSTHYGENVHKALAAESSGVLRHFPALNLPGVDRTCGSGAFQSFLAEIRTVLNQIIDVLEAKRFVHVDLRVTNVMIQVEEDGRWLKPKGGVVKLKVIDFDWAGEYGKVEYPANRNTVNIVWPKPEGGGDDMRIGKSDDRKMVNIWWNSYAS